MLELEVILSKSLHNPLDIRRPASNLQHVWTPILTNAGNNHPGVEGPEDELGVVVVHLELLHVGPQLVPVIIITRF